MYKTFVFLVLLLGVVYGSYTVNLFDNEDCSNGPSKVYNGVDDQCFPHASVTANYSQTFVCQNNFVLRSVYNNIYCSGSYDHIDVMSSGVCLAITQTNQAIMVQCNSSLPLLPTLALLAALLATLLL
eukprot:TRINITY_DN12701_c0_g1_i1.p1 TRINITY_DN12701_c0_g1~~TRINITY_DN12701_c0_g1_i1.p1  ORF type:complete len:137 (+),score=30.82 TRINITY_DN12701_c0_g1_i1:33-413(+)